MLVPLKDNPPLAYAGVYSNSNSGTTFGMEGITDGSSNTAMFSETLMGSGPAAPVSLSATTRPSTYLWFVATPQFLGPGPCGGSPGHALHAGVQVAAGHHPVCRDCSRRLTATSGWPATRVPA